MCHPGYDGRSPKRTPGRATRRRLYAGQCPRNRARTAAVLFRGARRMAADPVATSADPAPTPGLSALDADPVFALHRGGKVAVTATVPLRDRDDLSMAYTPGVARVCTAIADAPELVYDYTWKSSSVAIVTDGTAVLGLGDIGPEAALPVMEGK